MNRVGGMTDAEANVISGNLHGVMIGGTGADLNSIQGNYIGTNFNGTGALPNYIGIQVDRGAYSTFIGGAAANASNLISGNTVVGIVVRTAPLTNIQGNYIGTANNGVTALENGTRPEAPGALPAGGIIIDHSIGSVIMGNRIGFNGGNGVTIYEGAGIGQNETNKTFDNTIRKNAIFNNAKLGIDLQPGADPDGLRTLNDSGDGDAGPNDLQNHPVLTSAARLATRVQMRGSLNGLPSARFTMDYYASDAADPSGYGEGQQWIGSQVVTTGASGDVLFTGTFAGTQAGRVITATATSMSGRKFRNTSEFSNALPVMP